MQIAFKEQRPGEFAWNRELLSGGEWTADSGEETAGCKQRPSVVPREKSGFPLPGGAEACLSSRQGARGKPVCS